MIVKHKLKIDFIQQGVIPRLNAMQNDANSRAMEISLLENGVPWEVPADVTAVLNYSKPDGTTGLYDTLPDGSAAYTISGSTVTIFLAPQVLTVPGLVRASVILTRDTAQIATFPLSILVDANPGAGAEKSENYYHYTNFDELNDAIGNLADLKTKDKSSMVAAVNEIALGAGSGTVKSINGIEPDANGNVEIDAGEPGFSPIVMVNEITGGTYVHIRDQEGTKSAYIPNGKDGKSVTVSTTIESTEDEGLNVVTFTDMKSITIKNGSKGSKGDPGYSPVKGTDYWTEEDKAGIVAEVVEALDDSPEIIITTNELGYWYNNNGKPEFYVPTDGSTPCSKETNYINIAKGDIFRITTMPSSGHEASGGWYDADKNIISVIIVEGNLSGGKTVDLTAPADTAYARFFSYSYGGNPDDVPLEVEYLGQGEETAEYASPLKGKKIVYDGDSICSSWGISTNGGSYPQIIADIVGGTFDNQGVGGGRIVTQEGSSDTFHSIVDNLVNLPTDGDLYCFEGGVNDHWHDVPLGTYSKSDYTGALDKTTYCGALETIFRYATTKFVGKPICYIITHKCPYSAFSTYGTEHTFADFREAALGICEKYSIPVYDAWKDSGINSWNAAQLAHFFIVDEDTGTGDGTHPNEAGYRRYYVPQLIDLFERIMPIGAENVEAGEVDPEPAYTNLIPTAVDVDGSTIYNGKGYKENTRISGSSGEFRDNTGSCCTGYMDISDISGHALVYLKNVITDQTGANYGCYIALFNGTGVAATDTYGVEALNNYGVAKWDDSGNLVQFEIWNDNDKYTHMVISAVSITDQSIITVNEPI